MKQKQSYGILSKAIIVGRNKISVYTKAAVLSLYENDEFTYLMPGIKDFAGVSRNVCQQKWLILHILKAFFKRHSFISFFKNVCIQCQNAIL